MFLENKEGFDAIKAFINRDIPKIKGLSREKNYSN